MSEDIAHCASSDSGISFVTGSRPDSTPVNRNETMRLAAGTGFACANPGTSMLTGRDMSRLVDDAVVERAEPSDLGPNDGFILVAADVSVLRGLGNHFPRTGSTRLRR